MSVNLPFGRTSISEDEVFGFINQAETESMLDDLDCEGSASILDSFLGSIPEMLEWVEMQGREYPWRNTQDPWKIYITEILLQRTRADQVQTVYEPFFNNYSGPAEIREADNIEIRNDIEMLGFAKQRTRTITDIARFLGEHHDDRVPSDQGELMKPWRVGPYSARATLLFAFNRPMGLVDSNIARVLSRIFDLSLSNQPHKNPDLLSLMTALGSVDPGYCRAFHLALLDIGDAICSPNNPDCPSCPLLTSCQYATNNIQ